MDAGRGTEVGIIARGYQLFLQSTRVTSELAALLPLLLGMVLQARFRR